MSQHRIGQKQPKSQSAGSAISFLRESKAEGSKEHMVRADAPAGVTDPPQAGRTPGGASSGPQTGVSLRRAGCWLQGFISIFFFKF